MRFWDTSAIVALLIVEDETERVLPLSLDPTPMAVWWGTIVESESALNRREREGRPDPDAIRYAREELSRLETIWTEIEPGDDLRQEARRMLRIHPLRAADAFQLASALTAADGSPAQLPFVCLDDRLREAARREGFPVLP